MDFFKSKVREKQLDEKSSKYVLQMARMWGDFVGEPIEKQSLKYFWLEECIEGGKSVFLKTMDLCILNRHLRLYRQPLSSKHLRVHPAKSCRAGASQSQRTAFDESDISQFKLQKRTRSISVCHHCLQ